MKIFFSEKLYNHLNSVYKDCFGDVDVRWRVYCTTKHIFIKDLSEYKLLNGMKFERSTKIDDIIIKIDDFCEVDYRRSLGRRI